MYVDSKTILEEFSFAIEAYHGELACIEKLITTFKTGTSLVNLSGLDDHSNTDKMETYIFELEERREVLVNCAQDCMDALHEALRLIGTLGTLGMRERWRALLVKHYLEGLSWRHTAELLGLDPKNARTSRDAAFRFLDAALYFRISKRYSKESGIGDASDDSKV